MTQINNTKKPPQFDGSNYPYWKAKMTTYIKSINRKVWKVVETKIEIANEEAPTAAEEVLLQNNDIALSAIHDVMDERTLVQLGCHSITKTKLGTFSHAHGCPWLGRGRPKVPRHMCPSGHGRSTTCATMMGDGLTDER